MTIDDNSVQLAPWEDEELVDSTRVGRRDSHHDADEIWVGVVELSLNDWLAALKRDVGKPSNIQLAMVEKLITALMWAASERHSAAVKTLIDRGADVNARSHFVPAANGRGFEGRTPVAPTPGQAVEEFASGWLTPLMFAAREGDVESARLLVAAGADVNAIGSDGKDALGLAIFDGNYDLGSFLVDNTSKVNQADTQGFTPLFWAVDRRNMETAPNFPWMVTTDPLPLIKKLLDAGANPNALVNNTPRARMRAGSPRIVFATALMRAAFAGDLELVKLLLAKGADHTIVSKDWAPTWERMTWGKRMTARSGRASSR
ncbi:MAG: ankyrin repeat domain-containing protein [Vicinamibacterales bacterium]|nr:ankyrin repeat domain-containing protein [Vicinamibacterales bacterium]